jgi:hypothetical protein
MILDDTAKHGSALLKAAADGQAAEVQQLLQAGAAVMTETGQPFTTQPITAMQQLKSCCWRLRQ